MSDVLSSPEQALLQRAIRALDAGGVVAYPTETVWGLAAYPAHATELYLRKGRETGKPLQVSCADASAAFRLAQPSVALEALSACWPGSLTVITRARADLLPAWGAAADAIAPGGWIGLRVPAHPVAQALLRATGPLATTSLNPSGQPAAQTQAEAEAYALANLLLPSSEESAAGLPSTVVRLPADADSPAQLLRVGGVSRQELQALLSPLGLQVVQA